MCLFRPIAEDGRRLYGFGLCDSLQSHGFRSEKADVFFSVRFHKYAGAVGQCQVICFVDVPAGNPARMSNFNVAPKERRKCVFDGRKIWRYCKGHLRFTLLSWIFGILMCYFTAIHHGKQESYMKKLTNHKRGMV